MRPKDLIRCALAGHRPEGHGASRRQARVGAPHRHPLRGWWRALAAAALLCPCGAPSQNRARLTVATSWGPLAAATLHQELLAIARDLKTVDIDLQTYSAVSLQDVLSRQHGTGGDAEVDLAVVPNDWLGRLAQRGALAELSLRRIGVLQEELVGQALLAVTDEERVLAYPLSGEVLAFVYNSRFFSSPPDSIEQVITASSLPEGVAPIAFDLLNPYHVMPLASSLGGLAPDATGTPLVSRDLLADLVVRLSPAWRRPGAWRMFRGEDLESLHVQLFAEGRLASFIAGPWLLEALELTGEPFVVVPIPPFASGGPKASALVGYQCAAVLQDTPWLDLALEIGARLASEEVNDRLNQATRRLPVRLDAYRSRASIQAPGTLGFLRALEGGRPLPAGAGSLQRIRELGDALGRIGLRQVPPGEEEVRSIFAAEDVP